MKEQLPDPARRGSASKKDEVYDRLVGRLMRAEWAFGERIGVKELALEMGVSRQPIMAALNRLDSDGFVRIVPQVGCQVIDPGRAEIGDFFLMFQRFEGLLAELAATRRSEADVRELRELQERLAGLKGKPGDTSADYVALNRAFHSSIHQMARSPMLAERQRANFDMCDFFITHSAGFGRLMAGTAQEHDAIIDAVARRVPDGARGVAEVHIGSVAHMVLVALEQREAA